MEAEFGREPVLHFSETIEHLKAAELLEQHGPVIRLSGRGRLLSNEVFERFISVDARV